jgi:hypothetical protein
MASHSQQKEEHVGSRESMTDMRLSQHYPNIFKDKAIVASPGQVMKNFPC